MKRTTTIILLLIFAPIILLGQLNGEYCHSYNGFGYKCINFLDSNKFEYTYSDCTQHYKGGGIYNIKGNDLVLQFQIDSSIINKVNKVEKVKTNADTSLIEVFMYDKETDDPLYCHTYIKEKLNDNNLGSATNYNGYATFIIDHKINKSRIFFNCFGYIEYSDTITTGYNYKFTVYLSSSELCNYVGVLNFKIKNIKKNSIKLKMSDNKETIYESSIRDLNNLSRPKGVNHIKYKQPPYEIYEKK